MLPYRIGKFCKNRKTEYFLSFKNNSFFLFFIPVNNITTVSITVWHISENYLIVSFLMEFFHFGCNMNKIFCFWNDFMCNFKFIYRIEIDFSFSKIIAVYALVAGTSVKVADNTKWFFFKICIKHSKEVCLIFFIVCTRNCFVYKVFICIKSVVL